MESDTKRANVIAVLMALTLCSAGTTLASSTEIENDTDPVPTRWCNPASNGCPGRGCTSSSPPGQTCVICDAIIHELCTSTVTEKTCTKTVAMDCPTAAKGYCSASICIPYNPQLNTSCGYFGVCR